MILKSGYDKIWTRKSLYLMRACLLKFKPVYTYNVQRLSVSNLFYPWKISCYLDSKPSNKITFKHRFCFSEYSHKESRLMRAHRAVIVMMQYIVKYLNILVP